MTVQRGCLSSTENNAVFSLQASSITISTSSGRPEQQDEDCVSAVQGFGDAQLQVLVPRRDIND